MPSKKNRTKKIRKDDGDELLLDDDAADIAVTSKAQTKKQKVGGRKTGPTASKKTGSKKTGSTSSKKAGSKKTTPTKAKASTGKRERKSVEHKAPKAGSKFTAKYKGKTHTMTVKKAKGGGVVYVVKGKSYKSPSAAALPVVNRERGPNGWTFWGIEKVR